MSDQSSDISISKTTVTIILSIVLTSIGGGYAVGNADRTGTIARLESTIKEYENLGKQNLPDLLKKLVATSEVLSLNSAQQERLVVNKEEVNQLNYKVSMQSKKISELNSEQLKNKKLINALQAELESYTANTKKFTVKVGGSYEVIPNEVFIGVTYVGLSTTDIIWNNEKQTLNIGQSHQFSYQDKKCSVFVTDMDFEYKAYFKFVCKS